MWLLLELSKLLLSLTVHSDLVPRNIKMLTTVGSKKSLKTLGAGTLLSLASEPTLKNKEQRLSQSVMLEDLFLRLPLLDTVLNMLLSYKIFLQLLLTEPRRYHYLINL